MKIWAVACACDYASREAIYCSKPASKNKGAPSWSGEPVYRSETAMVSSACASTPVSASKDGFTRENHSITLFRPSRTVQPSSCHYPAESFLWIESSRQPHRPTTAPAPGTGWQSDPTGGHSLSPQHPLTGTVPVKRAYRRHNATTLGPSTF